ncbi:MAG: hypothetical protein ACYTHJ_15335 [Planctomycetota bacterium]|jgi:hypothetical protein
MIRTFLTFFARSSIAVLMSFFVLGYVYPVECSGYVWGVRGDGAWARLDNSEGEIWFNLDIERTIPSQLRRSGKREIFTTSHDDFTYLRWLGVHVERFTTQPATATFVRLYPVRLSLLALLILYLMRLPDRLRTYIRRRRGLCVQCSFNLTGNTSGICPECGITIKNPALLDGCTLRSP